MRLSCSPGNQPDEAQHVRARLSDTRSPLCSRGLRQLTAHVHEPKHCIKCFTYINWLQLAHPPREVSVTATPISQMRRLRSMLRSEYSGASAAILYCPILPTPISTHSQPPSWAGCGGLFPHRDAEQVRRRALGGGGLRAVSSSSQMAQHLQEMEGFARTIRRVTIPSTMLPSTKVNFCFHISPQTPPSSLGEERLSSH